MRCRSTLAHVTHDQNEALLVTDPVIVVSEGEIVPAGTPQVAVRVPGTPFVGWFIGSPDMDFLPCQLKAGGVGIDGTGIFVGEWIEAAKLRPEARLELGIRPKSVEVAERGTWTW